MNRMKNNIIEQLSRSFGEGYTDEEMERCIDLTVKTIFKQIINTLKTTIEDVETAGCEHPEDDSYRSALVDFIGTLEEIKKKWLEDTKWVNNEN